MVQNASVSGQFLTTQTPTEVTLPRISLDPTEPIHGGNCFCTQVFAVFFGWIFFVGKKCILFLPKKANIPLSEVYRMDFLRDFFGKKLVTLPPEESLTYTGTPHPEVYISDVAPVFPPVFTPVSLGNLHGQNDQISSRL